MFLTAASACSYIVYLLTNAERGRFVIIKIILFCFGGICARDKRAVQWHSCNILFLTKKKFVTRATIIDRVRFTGTREPKRGPSMYNDNNNNNDNGIGQIFNVS